jgi:hypothetical protein
MLNRREVIAFYNNQLAKRKANSVGNEISQESAKPGGSTSIPQ